MSKIPIPVYFTVGEVAKMLGWGPKRTRRWLNRAGCLVERGGKQVVATERLKAEYPEIYERSAQQAYEAAEFGPP